MAALKRFLLGDARRLTFGTVALAAMFLLIGLIADVPRLVLFLLLVMQFAALAALVVLNSGRSGKPRLRLEKQETPADFRSILDAVPAPTILIDRRSIVVHANRAGTETFPGLRQAFPLSAALRDPALLGAVEAVIRTGREARIDLIERLPIERSFLVAIHPLVLGGQTGHSGAVLHLIETTQSRQVERMRADFVANASHELRTPLASILGFVETLQGAARDDSTARARFLGIIADQARRMSRLINDLLSLSRLEMSAHIQPSEVVDLRLLVPHVFDLLAGSAAERKVRLELEATDGLAAVVLGDRDELIRLLENLIENAIKYGGSGRLVRVSLAQERGDLIIAVRDFGPGVPREHLPRLTERFYRVNTAESREQGGTGLGLAICKHIVMRHRGRLEIECPDAGGTMVSVAIPMFEKNIK